MTLPTATSLRKFKVFLSYARLDKEFAKRIVGALESRGIEVKIDERDLPLAEEWQRELLEFIREADAFVFIVSEVSVDRPWCKWEIGEAARLGKRLAPVVLEPVAVQRLPEALRAIQLIEFVPPNSFEERADQLATALQTNSQWVRNHTLFGQRARLWVDAGHPTDSHVLTGSELSGAEAWLLRKPGIAPDPTKDQIAFIQASRLAANEAQEAERRQIEQIKEEQAQRARFQKRFARTLAGLFALSIVAAGGAVWLGQLNLKREAWLFASQAAMASEGENCDAAIRYAVAGLPPPTATPFAHWSPEAEAQLARATWACRLIRRVDDNVGGVTSVAASPDGRQVATGNQNGTLILRDIETGRMFHRFSGHEGRVNSVAFSRDGQQLLTSAADGTARLWDVASGSPALTPMRHDNDEEDGRNLFGAQFSPDPEQQFILSFGADRTARLWRRSTAEPVHVYRGHLRRVMFAAFSPDGTRFVTGGAEKIARIWSVAADAPPLLLEHPEGEVLGVAFSPDGKLVATASTDGKARLWVSATSVSVQEMIGHEDHVTAIAFNPDPQIRTLLTASDDRTARLWDVSTGQELRRFNGHKEAVTSAAFNETGTHILTGGSDGTARLWEAKTGRELLRFAEHERGVDAAVFAAKASRVVTVSMDGSTRIWNARSTRFETILHRHAGPMIFAAFSPDGRHIAMAPEDGHMRVQRAGGVSDGGPMLDVEGGPSAFSPDGRLIAVPVTDTASRAHYVRIFDLATSQEVARLPDDSATPSHGEVINFVAFDPSGERILTTSDDHTARIWSLVTRKVLHELKHHSKPIFRGEFSPDGKHVATPSDDKSIGIWNATTGEFMLELRGHTEGVKTVSFNFDGSMLVSASDDYTVRLWSMAEAKQLHEIWPHNDREVKSAFFNRAGTRILTAGDDATVRIWDVATRIEVARLKGHEAAVKFASFNSAGDAVVTASDDKTVRLWNVEWASTIEGGRLRQRACAEKIVGAERFSPREMGGPLLRDRKSLRGPCERMGPMSVEFYEAPLSRLLARARAAIDVVLR